MGPRGEPSNGMIFLDKCHEDPVMLHRGYIVYLFVLRLMGGICAHMACVFPEDLPEPGGQAMGCQAPFNHQ